MTVAQGEIYPCIDAKETISLTNVSFDAHDRRVDIVPNRLHPTISEQELAPMIS